MAGSQNQKLRFSKNIFMNISPRLHWKFHLIAEMNRSQNSEKICFL